MRLPIQSMEAVLIRPHDSREGTWFRSVIVDFVPDKELVIVVPRGKDEISPNSPDADPATPQPAGAEKEVPVEADAASPDGADAAEEAEELDDRSHLFTKGTKLDVEISFPDGIRRFNSVVRKLDLTFGGSLRIDWPVEGTRIQRRDFVRVEVSYPTVVWFQDPESDGLQKVAGATIDLSAGGVRLQLPRPLPADMEIEIEIATGPLKGRGLQGRVVRSGKIATKRRQENPEFWLAVEFVGVDEALRKDMTQIVFDLQREQLRRGLG